MILRVATCNVRQMDGADGLNAWQNRRDLLVETLASIAADLIGTQETWPEQADYIAARLPGYVWFGSGRYGTRADKHTAILYRPERLTLVENGDLWLSETPQVPGSTSWEIDRPRTITWAVFETAARDRFLHLNTHFPYRKHQHLARMQTARLLVELLDRHPPSMPAILTADSNSPPGGEVHELLLTRFSDAWETAARRKGPEATVHGFGRRQHGSRVDWILLRGPWKPLLMEVNTHHEGELYPSDHYPVFAELELAERA